MPKNQKAVHVDTEVMLNMKEVADALSIGQKALRVRLSKGKFIEPTARKGDDLFWSVDSLRGVVAPTARVLEAMALDEALPF